MRHKFSFVVTFWWVVVLMALGLALIAWGPREERASETENRTLAGAPTLSARAVLSGEYMAGVESFLSDGFFGRRALVSLSEDIMRAFSLQSTDELLTSDIVGAIDEEFADSEAGRAPEATPATPAAALTASPDPTAAPTPAAEAAGATRTEPPESDYTPLKEYEFWLKQTDGQKRHVYSYTPESIENLLDGLNGIRALLPEDGGVHFALVPVAQSANWWTRNKGDFCGWESNAEEYMEALADEGVYIYNGPALLERGLANGEYLYYRTDHHWTPRGAYKVFAAMMERQGLPVTDFNDYDYTVRYGFLGSVYTETPTSALKKLADSVEIPSSLAPVGSYTIKRLTEQTEMGYMAYARASYLAYLYGTQTPYRRIVGGFNTGRVALVVSDSFGNCFAPYLLPYYDEVHMVDLRKGNYDMGEAGALVSEYMKMYGVDDVYVVLCTASGLNYNYTQIYLTKYF